MMEELLRIIKDAKSRGRRVETTGETAIAVAELVNTLSEGKIDTFDVGVGTEDCGCTLIRLHYGKTTLTLPPANGLPFADMLFAHSFSKSNAGHSKTIVALSALIRNTSNLILASYIHPSFGHHQPIPQVAVDLIASSNAAIKSFLDAANEADGAELDEDVCIPVPTDVIDVNFTDKDVAKGVEVLADVVADKDFRDILMGVLTKDGVMPSNHTVDADKVVGFGILFRNGDELKPFVNVPFGSTLKNFLDAVEAKLVKDDLYSAEYSYPLHIIRIAAEDLDCPHPKTKQDVVDLNERMIANAEKVLLPQGLSLKAQAIH